MWFLVVACFLCLIESEQRRLQIRLLLCRRLCHWRALQRAKLATSLTPPALVEPKKATPCVAIACLPLSPLGGVTTPHFRSRRVQEGGVPAAGSATSPAEERATAARAATAREAKEESVPVILHPEAEAEAEAREMRDLHHTRK